MSTQPSPITSPLASLHQASVALPQLRTIKTLHSLRSLCQRLAQTLSRTGGLRFQAKPRRLKLQETVQLGDKRFIAILRVDGDEFLLGGGTAGISILGQLHPEPAAATTSFAAVLQTHCEQSHRAQEDPA